LPLLLSLCLRLTVCEIRSHETVHGGIISSHILR
jgi:hypothetical protein